MARRQRHVGHVTGVPGRDDQAAAVWRPADLFDEIRDLVDLADDRRAVRPPVDLREVAPLVAVDRPEVAVFIRPFVPDRDTVFLEVADVRIAREEPEQLMHDRTQMQLLGRDQREPLGQRIAALHPEIRCCARPRPVGRGHALIEHRLQRIQILPHRCLRLTCAPGGPGAGPHHMLGLALRQPLPADSALTARPPAPYRFAQAGIAGLVLGHAGRQRSPRPPKEGGGATTHVL